MKQRSITRRLIASVLLIQLASALGVIAATFLYERHTRFQAFDVMLRGRADSLLGAVQDAEDAEDNVMLDPTGIQLAPGDVYEVQEVPDHLLGRSSNWKGAAADLAGEPAEDSIFRSEIGGVPYRFIRTHGLRVVDPGTPRGGKSHTITILYGSPTRAVWREIREAVVFYALASCLLLLLTGALVFFLLHRALSPLRELATEAEAVSGEHWTFVPPASARATRELAPLALALESAVQRLERSFDGQRHFISDAAHELKTGVAVLKSSVQLLAMRPRSPEDYQSGLERCMHDCERMEDTVHTMLTLARLETPPNVAAGASVTDLALCASAALRHLQPMAELREVSLRAELGEPVLASLTREEGNLLCSNLLMNALQHSKPSGEVRISVSSDPDGSVDLQIQDHGEGISPTDLPFVFERFYRGDPSRARTTGGTGLGLAICKAIVQKAGGTIELQSDAETGTLATVHLPSASLTHQPLSAVTPAHAPLFSGG